MDRRLELQSLLEELLGSRNVYYDPPANIQMKYDAIKYKVNNIESTFANNTAYSLKKRYEIIVIAKKSDHPVIEKLLRLPHCTHDRHYKSDNLSHDVLTLYY